MLFESQKSKSCVREKLKLIFLFEMIIMLPLIDQMEYTLNIYSYDRQIEIQPLNKNKNRLGIYRENKENVE